MLAGNTLTATCFVTGSYFLTTPKHENYEEQLVIPRAERSVIDEAIQAAVKEKRLWLLSDRTSLLAEEVPNYLLVEDAIVQAPPSPVPAKEIMPDYLPEAWNREETTAQSISDALSTKLGKVLPWVTVRETITTAINSRWVERIVNSGPWPCDYSGAQAVKLCVRKEPSKKMEETAHPYPPAPSPQPDVLVAEADLSIAQLQDFSDNLSNITKVSADVGAGFTFHLRMELKGQTELPAEVVEKINMLLQEVSEKLKLS